jgi:hypothetical protein
LIHIDSVTLRCNGEDMRISDAEAENIYRFIGIPCGGSWVQVKSEIELVPRNKKANHLDATNLRMRTAMLVHPQDR